MKILENTQARLVVRSGIPFLASTMCVFDKESGTANIERSYFQVPLRRVSFPLRAIQRVCIVKRKQPQLNSYRPALIMGLRQPVELPGFSKTSAKAMFQLIREFLMAE